MIHTAGEIPRYRRRDNMTQIATVERILDADHAEISVPRKSACGHDCEECAGCGVTGAAVRARASNPIGAQPGQKVVVESEHQEDAADRGTGVSDPCGAVSGRISDHGPGCGASVAVQYDCGGGGLLCWASCFAVCYDRHAAGQGRADLHHRPAVLTRCSAMCGRPLGDPAAGGDRRGSARTYCGLCHTLGERYGLASRFILNYDFTYLAILLSDRAGAGPCRQCRCPASPFTGAGRISPRRRPWSWRRTRA